MYRKSMYRHPLINCSETEQSYLTSYRTYRLPVQFIIVKWIVVLYILIYNISSKSIFLFHISLPCFILKNNIKINWRENVKIWREGNENVLDRFLFDIFSWLHTPVWTCVKCKPIPLAHLSRMVTHTSGFPFESLNYSLKWKRKLLPKVPSYCTK